jgi:CheY-like chemotaxis protein
MSRVAVQVAGTFGANRPGSPEPAGGKSALEVEKFPTQVLVVDDEPLIRWSVTETLAGLGLTVVDAPDAATALKMVTTSPLPFQVVVVDLRLPDMNDLSLLSTLRQLLPKAHLILMTAFGTPEVIDDAKALGADVLPKPFELGELNRLVLAHHPGPH